MKDFIHSLTTEQVNPATMNIDQLPTRQIIELINEEDKKVADAVARSTPQIALAVDCIFECFQSGGRLFYIGAGSSGRSGIIDATECPPTFGTVPHLVQGIIAGGKHAVWEAVEGAEDSEELGASDIDSHSVTVKDVVVGIAASGRTPYVIGAMKRAKEIGAKVIGLSNNAAPAMSAHADIMIEAVVGPEAVMGSTRMKAGTAQKMILNMLTTASMIKMGKVYGNLMVDLQTTNEKLVIRAKRIVKLATNAADEEIDSAFHAAGGHAKTAIVILLAGVDCDTAKLLLEQAGGFVHKAINHKHARLST